jgi:DNA polymerase
MPENVVTDEKRQALALLRWYVNAGVDEAVGNDPVNRLRDGTDEARPSIPVEKATTADLRVEATPVRRGPPQAVPVVSPAVVPPPIPSTQQSPLPQSPLPQPSSGVGEAPASTPPPRQRGKPPLNPDDAVRDAVALATAAQTLEDLHQALATFDGCGLSRTAMNLVFGDGAPDAQVVFIGEAPGAEEDRVGKPFVGPSGRLLDKMIASIGLDRTNVFISNTIYWRPPGNRSPTSEEMAACMPFLERIIEIIDPACVVALGGPAAAALLGKKESVGRLRGRWFNYQTPRMVAPVPATALFHPAYLLRSPGQKRLAWRDLLALRRKLDALAEAG